MNVKIQWIDNYGEKTIMPDEIYLFLQFLTLKTSCKKKRKFI